VTDRPAAHLVCKDGTVFAGEAIGALATGAITAASGELVFNTAMSGYQEVLTDPSYAGQVIAFTYPHIGNCGVNAEDAEAAVPFARGIVVRELNDRPSNWRSEEPLETLLTQHGIGGLTGVDTRRLTRHVREAGAMPCAYGTVGVDELARRAAAEPGTLGVDLVSLVSTTKPYTVGAGPRRVVAYDFGMKTTILRNLARDATVEVVPATTPAAEVLARDPDGVFLSNGPGDPAALEHLTTEVRALLGEVPVFGICLGHQLLATALGGSTYKLGFGHHGANHPVRRIETGLVEVTSHNHGYAVVPDSVPGASVTHVNLNDGVIEGLAAADADAFSVQYHPEAGPGPHDARYLFAAFAARMDARRPLRSSR
jgi:carbamoyl-phosphate synthase small subunit